MKRFHFLRFAFALAAAAGIVWLCCAVHKEDPFSLRNLSDGLFIAAAVELLYSLEFLHTVLGHRAASFGSASNEYARVRANMGAYSEPERPIIPEYFVTALLAGAAGLVLTLLK
jgi:hypothetical protein